MAVDTGIYGNIRPFKLDDPLDQAAKAASLRAVSRQFTLEDDLSAIGRETGGDLTKMSAALLQRGHVAPAIQLATSATAQDKARAELLSKNMKTMRDVIAAASSDADMPQVRNAALQLFGPEGAARIPERFTPEWQRDRLMDADARLKALTPNVQMVNTGGSTVAVNTNPQAGTVGPLPGATPIQNTGAPTELARLTAERDALPANDPRRREYDRVIANYKAGRGSGDITIKNPGPLAPGKPGQNKVDEDLLDTTRNLMRLDTIAGQFKPEFQTLMTRGSNWWTAAKETLGGKLTNKERQDLTEFSQYKRNAIDSLNQYIKSITGAAMTDAEAQRILKGLPNPGTGLFDGDSPTEFKAKLDDAMKQTRMSVARLAYIKRNGMSLEDGQGNAIVPLSRMPALINERGIEIERVLQDQDPNVKGDALKRAVRRQLSLEFGLAAD